MRRLARRSVSRRLMSVLLPLAIAAAPVRAQERETVITLSVGPSVVDFGEFGGPFPAGVVRLSASTDFSRLLGAEAPAFALAPLGRQTAIPECVPGGSCQTRTSPSMLSGFLGTLLISAGESGFRAAVGGGSVSAQGGEGFSRRSTVAGLVGLDWIPRSNSRLAPTFSIRLMQLSAPIAGARQLLLPGIGLSF